MRLRILILYAALCSGCSKDERRAVPSAPAPSAAPAASANVGARASSGGFVPGDASRGEALVKEFECSRCHEGTGVASAAPDQHCVSCHQQILKGTFKASAAALAKWRPNVQRVRDVPSLVSVGKRLRAEWLEGFLLEPHDLRPNLWQSMPRLKLTPAQAKDIVTYLVHGQAASAPATFAGANASSGRELFEAKGCGSCHVMSGVDAFATQPKPGTGSEDQQRGLSLAPDLRFARERLRPELVIAWILDPKAIKNDTLMTPSPLSPPEARDIAAYIFTAALAAPAAKPSPARLAKLTRQVSFEEVNERVFMKTCRHCHGDPDSLLGDGGPGNTGGFGFKPRGLNLSHYRGVMSGRLDENGERESVFTPLPDGTPRLLAALLARQSEEAGKANPLVRGMPLSLPSLPPEDIQLLETWIAQGRRP